MWGMHFPLSSNKLAWLPNMARLRYGRQLVRMHITYVGTTYK